jgi:hypothetical protein
MMTKEELKKEAEENAKKRTKGFKCQDNCEKSYVMGALDFAEPREKQIEIDAEQIRALQKQNGELTDKVRELEDRLCNVANNLLDSWCRNEEDYCPHLAKLEKENAELQQKWLDESYEKAKLVEKWKHNGENIIQECKDIEGAKTFYEHQLTKAKKIIKKLVDGIRVISDPKVELTDVESFVAEAENFLNSEVEK